MAGPSRNWIFGPEPWAKWAGQHWSHWDLWFCLVAALDFDGDLSALAETIYARARLDRDGEARISHLDDLADRLHAAGLAASELAGPGIADARTRAKARRKVLAQGLSAHDFTEPMAIRRAGGCAHARCAAGGRSSRPTPHPTGTVWSSAPCGASPRGGAGCA